MSAIARGPLNGRGLVVALVLVAACRASQGGAERVRAAARGPRPDSMWAIPRVPPCSLLSPAAVAAVIGASVVDSRPGGTAVDGSACQYRGPGPFIVRLGLMSVNAYESLEFDFGERVSGIGTGALVDGPDALGDVTLIARRDAIVIHVLISGVIPGSVGQTRRAAAATLAREVLAHFP